MPASKLYIDTVSLDTAVSICKNNNISVIKVNGVWHVNAQDFYNYTKYRPGLTERYDADTYVPLGACYHHFRMSDAYNDPGTICGKCCTMTY